MVRSIKVTVFAFVPVLLMGCGGDGGNVNTREEVISRYSSGEKRVVAVYEGEGVNEEMTKRVTFSKEGEKIKIENKKEDKVRYYDQIKSDISSGSKLKEFMTDGAWVSEGGEVDGDELSGIKVYEKDSVYTVIKLGDVATKISKKANYKDRMKIEKIAQDGSKSKIRIYVMGPNKMRLGGYKNKEATYERLEVSELESEILVESVEEVKLE